MNQWLWIVLLAMAYTPPVAPPAPSGEVVLLGTGASIVDCASLGKPAVPGMIGTAAYANDESPCNAFDRDVTTRLHATTGQMSIGLDLGSGHAAVLTRWAASGATIFDNDSQRYFLQAGSVIQGSNDGSNWATLDTISLANGNYLRQLAGDGVLPRFAVANSTAYRYYRLLTPNNTNFGLFLSELEFIGNVAGYTGAAQPVEPVITPFGGHYGGGRVNVCMSSRTTSAAIYYTTNGTTPTTSSTLYTGCFDYVIPPGASESTIKAMAYDSGLSTPASYVSTAYFGAWDFGPLTYIRDVDWGDRILNQPGMTLECTAAMTGCTQGHVYWVGNQETSCSLSEGIWMAESDDRGVNFHSPKLIDDQLGGSFISMWSQTLAWNAYSGKFVIWSFNAGEKNGRIYTASNIMGPWTPVSNHPAGVPGTLQQTAMLVDSDGSGYLAYNDATETHLYVQKLTADYTDLDPANYVRIDTQAEALTIMKRGATYFLLFDVGANFCQSDSQANSPSYRYTTASNPLSGWSGASVSLFDADPLGGPYNGQVFYTRQFGPQRERFGLQLIYYADQTPEGPNYGRMFVLPLDFPTNTSAHVTTPATWNLSDWGPPKTIVRGAGARRGGTIR